MSTFATINKPQIRNEEIRNEEVVYFLQAVQIGQSYLVYTKGFLKDKDICMVPVFMTMFL